MKALCILLLGMFCFSFSYCQSPSATTTVVANKPIPDNAPPTNSPSPGYKTDAPSGFGFMTQEGFLSVLILGFGLLAIFGELFFIYKMGALLKMDAFDAIRLVTVTLIVVAALFVCTGTYDVTRTAATTGLLGTLAGYLLARSSQSKGTEPNSDQTNNTGS